MRWWLRLFRQKPLDVALDKEVRFHLEQSARDLIARGYDPQRAAREAALAFGGAEQVKERCRDARGTRWLEDLSQDVRYALRALWQRPAFAAVAIGTLALGIGAATIMFTVINGVLLRPLPYPEPERLVALHEETSWSTQRGNQWAFAYPNFLDCKRAIGTLSVAAWRFAGGALTGLDDPQYVEGREISASLFSILQIPIVQGRAFAEAEDRVGGTPVIVISEGLWRRYFHSNPATVGQSIVFDGQPRTIVGIVAADFRLAGSADVLTPIGQDGTPVMSNRNAHPGLQVWGRLHSGNTMAQAQSELTLVGSQLAAQYASSNVGRTFVAERLRPAVGDVQSTLWLLLGAVTLVLLIACVNVASLLLARAVSRDRELAMRTALGASRGRLIRQCLTESAVLGLFGAGSGVAVAVIGVRPFVAFWPALVPRAEGIQVDARVLLFAVVVALVSSVLFGLAPAWRVRSLAPDHALRGGGRTVAGASRRLHGALVGVEIATAIVLLISAGMLGRTLLRLSTQDPGVALQDVLVTRVGLSPSTLANPAASRAAWDDILGRAANIPGVQSVAIVDTVPMRTGNNQLGYSTTAQALPANRRPIALATSVTPDYLRAVGLTLRRGRFFDAHDNRESEPVIVVDDVFARQAFGDLDPVGKRVWFPDSGFGPFDIVGVVGHVRHWGLATDDTAQVRAQFYYPFAQLPDRFVRRWSELMSLVVRTNVAPLGVLEPLRHELRGITGDQVLYEVRTLDQLASGSLGQHRFLLAVFAAFAGVALLLACVGTYGVLSYLTSQRVPEIGVRMALGASAGSVVRLVLQQSLTMIGGGVAIGIVAAFIAGRLIERVVVGVVPTEMSTFAVMTAVLVGASLLASFMPARRASRVDPLTALRQN
jgi:predicted permease